MVRTVLKILLALALMTTGTFNAFGASTPAKHAHCHNGTLHAAHAKTPCCPDCEMPDEMAGCGGCAFAFIVAFPAPLSWIEHTMAASGEPGPAFVSKSPVPPTRPPIA